MKGSPILSTIIAIFIMVGAYLWLHLSLFASITTPKHTHLSSSDASLQNVSTVEDKIACYIEAHFSSPPQVFVISDPISGKIIASIKDLTDNEWSDEINLLKGESVELNILAQWGKDQSDDTDRQHFIQIILSPDQMEDSRMTLRNTGDIDTTATFQLRQ